MNKNNSSELSFGFFKYECIREVLLTSRIKTLLYFKYGKILMQFANSVFLKHTRTFHANNTNFTAISHTQACSPFLKRTRVLESNRMDVFSKKELQLFYSFKEGTDPLPSQRIGPSCPKAWYYLHRYSYLPKNHSPYTKGSWLI